MNAKELLASLQSRGLRAWQANFTVSFLEDNSPAFHLLAAPTGTGKMFTSIVIAAELVKRGAKRMLVLPPAPLCEQWKVRLAEAQSEIPALSVTRQIFREMEAALPIGQSPWNVNGIFVISQDLAKQSDLVAGLGGVDWDLVIVDEAHRFAAPNRAALLDRLLTAGVVRRLLLLSATPLPALDPWLRPSPGQPHLFPSPLKVTSWFGALKNWDGSMVASSHVNLQVFPFTRGADEVKSLSRILGLIRGLEAPSGVNRFSILLLYQRASSSLFAFEQSLQRLRHTLRSATEEDGVGFDEASSPRPEFNSGDEEFEPTNANRHLEWADKPATLAILEQCVEALEMISTDEKLNALRRLVRSIIDTERDHIPRVFVFSMFADTVSYLHTAIDDVGLPLSKLTGASSFAEREATVERFLQEGGVIIGTDAALGEGFTMPQVTHVIHYDLPSNPRVLEKRLGRFDLFGRDTDLMMYVFRDESNAMPLESKLVDLLTSAQRAEVREVGHE